MLLSSNYVPIVIRRVKTMKTNRIWCWSVKTAREEWGSRVWDVEILNLTDRLQGN